MKNLYFLLFSILMANTLFAQNTSQKAISNQLKLKAPFLNAYDTLPNGLVIDLESGETIETNYLPSAFSKPNTETKTTATKSTIKSALSPKHRVFSKTRMNSLNKLKSNTLENSSYQKDKIDKIVYYSPGEMVPTYGLKLQETSKIIRQEDENGILTGQIYKILDENSGEFINAEKVELESFAENKPSLQTFYEWIEDTWTANRKIETEYNEASKKTKEERYKWEDNTWITESKETYEYDEAGNQLSNRYYEANENKELIQQSNHEFTYHPNGIMATNHNQMNWDTSNELWQYETKEEYNDQGEITRKILKYWDVPNNDWRSNIEVTYEYLEDGSIEVRNFSWDSESQQMILGIQRRYKYANKYEGENLVEQVYSSFVEENWYNDWKKTYEYDSNNNVTEQIKYESNETDWLPKEKTTNKYDSNNKLIEQTKYVFRENEWLPTYKTINEYDQWGNQVLYDNAFWDENHWTTTYRSTREFIASGIQIKSDTYDWDSKLQTLVHTFKFRLELDSEERTISRISSKWDSDKEEWVINTKSLYNYPNDNETITEYYEQGIIGEEIGFEEDFTDEFYYDKSIGRYTDIVEDEWGVHFEYDDDLKLKQTGTYEAESDSHSTTLFEYNSENRCIELRYLDDYSPGSKTTFAYEELEDGGLRITDQYYPDANHDDINRENIYYYNSGGSLTMVVNKHIEDLEPEDTIKYEYNYTGKIETIRKETGEEHWKKVYSNNENILTVTTLRRSLQKPVWEPDYKIIYQLDTIDTIPIQPFPLTYSYEGLEVEYDWLLPFQFGKVQSETMYYYSETGLEIIYKCQYQYSPASLLSGEGIIDGYIFEGEGTTKSVTTTAKNNGAPFEGVVVTLCAKENDFVLATDTTDENGFYQFKGVPDGDFYIKVETDDYQQISTYNISVSWFQTQFEDKNFTVQNGEILTGINDIKQSIKVYPNPASDFIEINAAVPIISITITDTNGRCYLRSERLNSNTPTVSVQSLSPGLYILNLETDSTNFKEKILVVN